MAFNRMRVLHVGGWSLATALVVLFSFQFAFGLLITGFLVGFAQWAVSRRQIPIRVWWVPLTGIGWLLGIALATFVDQRFPSAGIQEDVLRGFYLGAVVGLPIGLIQAWRLGRWGFPRYRIVQFAGVVAGTAGLFGILALSMARDVLPTLPLGFAEGGAEGFADYGLRYDATVALGGLVLGVATALSIKAALDHPGGEHPARFRYMFDNVVRWIPETLSVVVVLYLVLLVFAVPTDVQAPRPEPLRHPPGDYETSELEDTGALIAERWDMRNTDGKPYTGYVFHGPDSARNVPLVLYLHGSGGESVLGFTQRHVVPQLFRRRFWLATLDKVGAVTTEGQDPGPDYFAYDTKEERVRNANQLVDALLKEHGRFAALYVVGYSEGVDVAARLARSRSDIRGIVLIGGGGYGQADEIRISLRRRADLPGSFFGRIQSMLIDRQVWRNTMRVLADPSPDRTILGLSHRRWASYVASSAAADLQTAEVERALSIHGGRDLNSPIESARYLAKVLEPLGNHRLVEYPDLDHSFRNPSGVEHIDDVFGEAFEWLFSEEPKSKS